MATIEAAQSGNWSDTSTWDGGVVPVNGDTADARSYVVEFDVDINQPDTLLTSTTGGFQWTGGGTREVTAKADAGTHTTGYESLIRNTGSGTLIFNGPVKGGAGEEAYGAYSGGGTLHVGTATGGAGEEAYGAYSGGGTLHVGTAISGTGDWAYGVYSNGGTLHVKRAISGPTGVPGFVATGYLFMVPDPTNEIVMRTEPNGDTVTLTPGGGGAAFYRRVARILGG